MVDAEVPELAPRAFRRALASVRAASVRPEVQVCALTAPSRMAPWASALAGVVPAAAGSAQPSGPVPGGRAPAGSAASARPGGSARTPEGELDDDLASGRFVLLHDPRGQAAWGGTFRVVVYLVAALDPGTAQDPMAADVAWSWLVDALDGAGAQQWALGGTATLVVSQPFGELADDLDGPGDEPGTAPTAGARTAEVELRASWTPPADGVGASVTAWTDLLAAAAGLVPLPEGVALLPRRLP